MGLFDGLFGSSENVTRVKPQVLEGLEGLTPILSQRATTAGTRDYARGTRMRGWRRSPNPRRPASGESRVSRPTLATGGSWASPKGCSAPRWMTVVCSMIGSLGRTIAPKQWTDRGTASAYMNPYQEQVMDRLLRREDERTGERRAALDARLAGKKAFGSGSDIARGMFERDEESRKADMIADQLSKSYESGANTFRSDADRALQGEDLTTRGIGQGTTAELSRLAGRRAAGNDMGTLADRWRTGMTENARSLLNVGNMEQQQAQRNIDVANKDWEEQRDYPENRADFVARILYGAPRGQTTTTPGPSGASQLLGAGLSVAGLGSGFGWWQKGGAVRLADGGFEDGEEGDLWDALNDPGVDPVTKEQIRRRLREAEGMDGAPLPPPKPSVPTLNRQPDGAFALPSMPSLDTGEGMPPPTGMAEAPTMAPEAGGSPDVQDRYASILDQLLEAQKPNKGMILARIGAAMAAGQKPGFLANVGEGLNAGVKGFDDEQQRRIRALGTAAAIEGRREDARTRSEDRKRADKIREDDLRERSADRKTQIKLAEDRLKETQRQFDQGKIGEADLRRAQTEYYRAKTEGEKSGKDRSTYIEREVARQMEEDPTLTRQEARAIVSGQKSKDAIARERMQNQREDQRRKFISEATMGGARPMSPTQQQEELRLYGPRPDRAGTQAEPASAGAAPAPKAGAKPAGMTDEQLVAAAKASIAKGKDKKGVAERLKGWGIDPALLDK